MTPLTMTKDREAELRPTVISWVTEMWDEVDATRAALQKAEAALAEAKRAMTVVIKANGEKSQRLTQTEQVARELLAALRLAKNTVECASIDRKPGSATQGEELPWYKTAKAAIQRATALLGDPPASAGCTCRELPTPDRAGFCIRCGGSLVGRCTTETILHGASAGESAGEAIDSKT